MDILDSFFDILLKPPQPLMGLFFMTYFHRARGAMAPLAPWIHYCLGLAVKLMAKYYISIKFRPSASVGCGQFRLAQTNLV